VAAIDQVRLNDLLERARDGDLRADVRGLALEDLAELMFAAVPGVDVVASRSVDVFRSQELDVVCRNHHLTDGLSDFDHLVIVECKNWSSPVGSMEVAWFDTKLRVRSRRTGVLIAMNGITGDPHSLTSANQIVSFALGEGRSILVLRVDEIEALQTGEDLATLLKRKEVELNLTRGLPN
jgi:hypothetical protein